MSLNESNFAEGAVMGSYRALAEKIAADLDPLYVADGPERFERADTARIVEHVLITAARQQPAGAVQRAEKAEAEVDRLKREYMVGYADGRHDERGSSLSDSGGR
jgi:hypothetical protein